MASEYAEESIDTFGLDDISTVSEQDCSEIEERQRIAPASARAALIAVVSATVIGGTRHAIELILWRYYIYSCRCLILDVFVILVYI